MDEQLTQLVSVLAELTLVHQELREHLQQEYQHMGRLSGSALLQLQSAKIMSARKIANLEEGRIAIVRQIAQAWEVEEATLTVSGIIAKSEETIARSLSDSFRRLQELIKEIQVLAQTNSQMSEARLKPIEMSLKFLADLQKHQQTYSDKGNIQSTSNKVSRAAV